MVSKWPPSRKIIDKIIARKATKAYIWTWLVNFVKIK